MSKFFLVNPEGNPVSSEELEVSEKEKISTLSEKHKLVEKKNKEVLQRQEELKFIQGRVIVKVNTEEKNSHTFQDGTKIRLERKYNEFNRRITEPTTAIVISAEHIPTGSEILIGHNSLHEVNRIYDYQELSGEDAASEVRYYSLPEEDCYAWRNEEGNLMPMKNYAFALRLFKPYNGSLTGIDPTIIKDVLYITTGEFKGNVVHVLKASDYEIIYQGKVGREERVIRLRHFEDDYNEKEEITAIAHDLTEQVQKGKLLIGLSTKDAKKLN